MEPVSTDGPLVVYVGGRHSEYVDYCRARGLNPNRHVHINGMRPVEGIHDPHIKIVHGDTSIFSDEKWVEIVAALSVLRSGTGQVDEEQRSA